MQAEREANDRGLLCALAFVAFGSITVALAAPQPLRALAAALVLWAPGYALSSLLLTRGTIGGVERAVIAVATSAALTILPAVLLEAAGVRLGTTSFLATGCAITWVSAGLALLRAPVPLSDEQLRLPPWRPPVGAFATLFGIGLVLAGSVAVARIPPEPVGILGATALAATNAGPHSVRTEVDSDEVTRTSYRLEMTTAAGTVTLARFTLRPGASWKRTIVLPDGQNQAELQLYRAEDSLPYRSVLVQGAPA